MASSTSALALRPTSKNYFLGDSSHTELQLMQKVFSTLHHCTRTNVRSLSQSAHSSLFLSRARAYSAVAVAYLPATAMNQGADSVARLTTRILPIDASKLGSISYDTAEDGTIEDICTGDLLSSDPNVQNLRLAANKLGSSDVPVAFPTETVYGLGADATRSAAVRGIYKAKQRPSDNPLIVHFASIKDLVAMMAQGKDEATDHPVDSVLPHIYKPLIKRFWPGPLTIILPNPQRSPLAPEVTAGLSTFGARIPRNLLALLLIKLSGKPIAAPSANASTKPSPTAAEHVKEDLDDRLEYIVDGGPCDVGVESTVVDGLSNPPAILRPGGISIEQIRSCPGWENVVVGYEDVSMKSGAPRAPGMKYRHYSPKAKVLLFAPGMAAPTLDSLRSQATRVGYINTRKWKQVISSNGINGKRGASREAEESSHGVSGAHSKSALESVVPFRRPKLHHDVIFVNERQLERWDISLGDHSTDVARDLFWALRELDRAGCESICVEAIADEEGDVAAAVMNRLRKAAEGYVTA